jgi:hypothetical protein
MRPFAATEGNWFSMAYNPDSNSYRTAAVGGYAATGAAALDQGLRAYMLRVYLAYLGDERLLSAGADL